MIKYLFSKFIIEGKIYTIATEKHFNVADHKSNEPIERR